MSTKNRVRLIPAIASFLGASVVLVTGTMLLLTYGPGDMGKSFAVGGTVAIIAFAFALWRAARRPQSASSLERSLAHVGDERDQRVATQSAAVVGVFSIPAVSVASVAIAIGARPEVALTLLLYSLLAVGAAGFVVTARRN